MERTTAERYDEIWSGAYGDMQDRGPAHRHLRRLLRRMLRRLDYRSALEIGCGAGHNLDLLATGRTLDRLTGLDPSPEALRRAGARHPEAELAQGDIEQTPPVGTWDLVLCSLVLEHLERDDQALRNMAAATGRWLLLATIAGDFERHRAWEEQVGHVRNYRRGELEQKAAAAGLRVERALYWGFPFYSPLARRLQNRMTAEPSYGAGARAVAAATNLLYYLNSSRRGDIVVLLATPQSSKNASPSET
jgi:SAM-dependent methyltransferase